MATIYDPETGNELTSGLQGCNSCDAALQAAERAADARGADVRLADDDGEWLVHPAWEDGSREAADPVEAAVPARGEQIRHGSFGPIVWDKESGETRMATQEDLDTLPVGEDLTAEEESTIEDDVKEIRDRIPECMQEDHLTTRGDEEG